MERSGVYEDIVFMREFYEELAYACFRYIPTGTSGIVNYESYIFESLRGTLD